MTPCKECGSPLRCLAEGVFMCARLYDLAFARIAFGDRRPTTHASLEEDDSVIPGAE